MVQAHSALFDGFEAPAQAGVTPAMAQFIEVKAANPDCLLFYRMGDFYELFFDDAINASKALGITLTKRGKYNGVDIPLAGVPAHSADDYLQKLIRLGFKVAVCEQLEDPAEAKKRGSKSVVRRDVVRLVTPGTITEDKLLVGPEANYLLALCETASAQAGQRQFGLAWIDISTGEFKVSETDLAQLTGDLLRIAPKEILLSDALFNDKALRAVLQPIKSALSPVPSAFSDSVSAERRLAAFFNVQTIESFGAFSRAELAAAGLVLSYVERTQRGSKALLSKPIHEAQNTVLQIDPAARINLELTQTLGGDKQGSLLHLMDRTLTAVGGRLLCQHLSAPLTDPDAINTRLDAVSILLNETGARKALRDVLRVCPDMLRSLSRLSLGRAGPRDLAHIRDGLLASQTLSDALQNHAGLKALPHFQTCLENLKHVPGDLCDTLRRALVAELPLQRRDGAFVAYGYSTELDEQRRYRDEAQHLIVGLQQNYVAQTGLKNLKIKHNNMIGYFIEVNPAGAEILRNPPHNASFFHRQSLANLSRFSTAELSDIQGKIFGAAELTDKLEDSIFDSLSQAILAQDSAIKSASTAIAALDISTALAELAEELGWTRPVVDNSFAFDISQGRHPVVEDALIRAKEAAFIANDCDLGAPNEPSSSGGKVWLLTGPNMAGKSTFLRQNALIVLLAQMGSFVPAKSAHIGVVDKLFSRVGAADDLARGRSTFMVEMVETAAILNQATERSLVILDEIGRGTATFDGLSIAWASLEFLHDVNRCRALFATHFHELTALKTRLNRVENMTMLVKEWQGDVVFLHEIGQGVADGSYGLQVARLAGLPEAVTARAKDVLAQLEQSDRAPKMAQLIDDLPLFSSEQEESDTQNRLEALLDTIEPDKLTPREALEALYALKSASFEMKR